MITDRRRAVLIAALGVSLLALVVSSFRTALGGPAGDRMADLNVYLGAVHAVQHGTPLYDYAAANGDQFTYPPFALLLFWPFAGLPLGFVQVAWTLATVAAALAIAVALVRRAELPKWQRGGIATLTAVVVVLHSAPLHSNLRFGQVSVFVILLALLDALDLVPRRFSGGLTGLAAAIKLTPVLFVPYLWLTGRRRAAIRSLATFSGAAALASVLWPSASITFWTHAVFTTSRIGDLAATGNQSINGTLLRYHLPTSERTAIWWVLAAAVCTVALLCAREYHRQGRIAYAAVVVGCATVAASPVSWTHHQVWTVLAGLLLVAGGRRVQLASGVALLLVMTLSVGDLVDRLGPGWQFLGDNARMLAALAVCLGGVASVWQPATATDRARCGSPTVPHLARSIAGQRIVLTGSGVLAVVAAVMLVNVGDKLVTVRTFASAEAAGPLADGAACGGFHTERVHGVLSEVCDAATGPSMYGDLQLNFGGGVDSVEGEVGERVARLKYVPVEGASPIDVPLLPLPAAPRFDKDADGHLVPVIVRQNPGSRWFAIATNDSTDASLIAYDAQGRIVGQDDEKLREH